MGRDLGAETGCVGLEYRPCLKLAGLRAPVSLGGYAGQRPIVGEA